MVPPPPKREQTVVVLGGGVGGLATAYELQLAGYRCTVLEARPITGGRCLTLRQGDTLVEDCFPDVQTCTFENGPAHQPYTTGYPPYFNAGPGRIPSAHKQLLSYLKKFMVALEVYVMDSRSNLTYVKDSFAGQPSVNRQLDNDTRGRIASLLYHLVDKKLDMADLGATSPAECEQRRKQLQSLLVTFGDLVKDPESGRQVGDYIGSTRSGYHHLPTIEPEPWVKPYTWNELLSSEFWKKTRFYSPQEFDWQPTLFEPVGGMDNVANAFLRNVEDLQAKILTSAVVVRVAFDEANKKYSVTYQVDGARHTIEADICISNIPIPLLKGVLDDHHFDESFREALCAVYKAQYFDDPKHPNRPRFLAATTKVGWQAPQDTWGPLPAPGGPLEESGSVPIFGGISWTTDEITQIWYPSGGFHNRLGILTGAYNYAPVAVAWGKLPPKERLALAQKQAEHLGGEKFAEGLKHGIAIAWQNIAHIKGGWAQWHALDEPVEEDKTFAASLRKTGPQTTRGAYYYNCLLQGNKNFYIVGDQMSEIPGWQEGAIISAINAVNRIGDPSYTLPELVALADTRIMVEGGILVGSE